MTTYKTLRFWAAKYGKGHMIKANINGEDYLYDHDEIIDRHFSHIKRTLSWDRGVYAISQRDCAKDGPSAALAPYRVRGGS